MRVRPFFWGLFVLVCLSILAWAAVAPSQVPARLSIHVMKTPTPEAPTPFLVVVTDAQVVTIDNAQLVSQAWMTNMSMAPSRIFTTPEGQGTYLIRITLDMVGPWMIAVSIQVNGFAPLQQTLAVQVLSAFAPETVRAPIGSGDAACAAAHGMRNESAARKR